MDLSGPDIHHLVRFFGKPGGEFVNYEKFIEFSQQDPEFEADQVVEPRQARAVRKFQSLNSNIGKSNATSAAVLFFWLVFDFPYSCVSLLQ